MNAEALCRDFFRGFAVYAYHVIPQCESDARALPSRTAGLHRLSTGAAGRLGN